MEDFCNIPFRGTRGKEGKKMRISKNRDKQAVKLL